MRVLAIGLLTALVGACGFHLQGHGPQAESLGAVQVTYDQPYRVGAPPLVMALENRLRAQGRLAATGAKADTRIHIDSLDTHRRLLSVSGVDGRAAEFELISEVRFDLRTPAGRAEDQALTVRRAYSFNNTERLAAEAERDDLIAAMQRELANLILLRANTLAAGQVSSAGQHHSGAQVDAQAKTSHPSPPAPQEPERAPQDHE